MASCERALDLSGAGTHERRGESLGSRLPYYHRAATVFSNIAE